MEDESVIMINNIVKNNLKIVQQRIESKCSACARLQNPPRLVAVSKTFPANLIVVCYEQSQRHFGENYVQELIEKSKLLETKCPEIRWHFIGRLQSNKIAKICAISNLWCVETLDTENHADLMQKALQKLNRNLNVFIQVNTSGEENKGGIEVSKLMNFYEYLLKNCPNLNIIGLMTIGSIIESTSNNQTNNDFSILSNAKDTLIEKINKKLELSMGMSHDFELAIVYGSTNVRVGSAIFGNRYYPEK